MTGYLQPAGVGSVYYKLWRAGWWRCCRCWSFLELLEVMRCELDVLDVMLCML